MRTQTTPAALSASVARLLLARFTAALHPTLPTPSNGRPSRPLRVVVASVRDCRPYWSARSMQCKCKNLPTVHPASVLLSPLPFIHRPSSPNLLSVISADLARLERRLCGKKTATTINQRGRKVCLPFAFLQLMILGLLIYWCSCSPSPRAG